MDRFYTYPGRLAASFPDVPISSCRMVLLPLTYKHQSARGNDQLRSLCGAPSRGGSDGNGEIFLPGALRASVDLIAVISSVTCAARWNRSTHPTSF